MIRAGTAVVDITPPPGSMMAAFPRGPERVARHAKGVHDPLRAKVLVLQAGEEDPVVLCTLDTCMIRPVDLGRIRSHVARHLPALGGPRLVVACSHTHSGPEMSYLFGNTPDDPWVVETDRRVANAVVAANGRLQPVSLSLARTTIDLTHNRRVLDERARARMEHEYLEGITTGPVDPELTVLRVDGLNATESEPLAILYHYTAHALTLGPKNDFYSADYPGVASRIIEEAFPDSTALFCNGAAGNVHPRVCMRADLAATEEIGDKLGHAVVESARTATPLNADEFGFVSDRITFPNRIDPAQNVGVELSCLRLDDVVFAFVPGEVFVEFQLAFKQRLYPLRGVFVGYSNGWPGYVPTREAYAQGGYGVDASTTDPPHYSRTSLPPGAGESIMEALAALANTCVTNDTG